MKGGEFLATMQFYVVIPLVACIVACAISSAVLARDPSARRSQLTAAILACAGSWALCDVLVHLLNSESVALSLVRLSMVPILAIAPLAFQLLLEQSWDLRKHYDRMLLPLWFGVASLMLLGVFTPAFVANVEFTRWGWMTKIGPLYFLAFVPGVVCVFAAFSSYRKQSRLKAHIESTVGRVLALVATLLLSVTSFSEVLAPMLGIAAPKLGALSVTVLGAILWFLTASLGEYVPLPSAFARTMLDNLSDGVALINRDGRIRTANQAFARLVQSPARDLIDVSLAGRLGVPLEYLREQGSEVETTLERADLTTIPVSTSRSDLRNHQGTRLGSVLVVRDLREVARLRRRIVAAGRLAAVGELAAGIVHEVNNPIAFIKSNLNSLHKNDAGIIDILTHELGDESVPEALGEVRHLIGQSLQSIDRVASIVKEVRGFSHMGSTGQQANDVNALLEDVVRIATPQLRARAALVRTYGDVPLVDCAAQDMRQVLLDLILSAAHSLAGSGTIGLRTFATDAQISIVVEDDGRGHSGAELEHMFDPSPGRGDGDTRPDLCVAYQIIRQHGGEIRMESELGRGTRVTVELPLAQSAVSDRFAFGDAVDVDRAQASLDGEDS